MPDRQRDPRECEEIPPRLLVTGSARLNIRRHGSDSLVGRYFHHRLYPFSLREVAVSAKEQEQALAAMLRFGCFPEPFLAQSEDDANRWRKEYVNLVLTQDVVMLEDIRDLGIRCQNQRYPLGRTPKCPSLFWKL